MAEKKQMPKGGRKGGTTFPRLALSDALKYAGKLVSKTHVGPQPEGVVLTGVFGTKNSDGKIRASALKQYTLLEVTDQGLVASTLAKQIEAAPEVERVRLFRKACLAPGLFKTLFDTFHGDQVTRARIRQHALGLKVHPESVDDCVEIFVSSLNTAMLATENQDGVRITSSAELVETDSLDATIIKPADIETDLTKIDEESADIDKSVEDQPASRGGLSKAVIQVNVNLDSSMDSEKLEKQLKLLRKYGAI
jgi:hypothetical protein